MNEEAPKPPSAEAQAALTSAGRPTLTIKRTKEEKTDSSRKGLKDTSQMLTDRRCDWETTK